MSTTIRKTLTAVTAAALSALSIALALPITAHADTPNGSGSALLPSGKDEKKGDTDDKKPSKSKKKQRTLVKAKAPARADEDDQAPYSADGDDIISRLPHDLAFAIFRFCDMPDLSRLAWTRKSFLALVRASFFGDNTRDLSLSPALRGGTGPRRAPKPVAYLLTSRNWRLMRRLEQISQLSLYGISLSGRDIAVIAQFPIASLSLGGTNVTDKMLTTVSSSKHITSLTLADNLKLTDQGIKNLSGLDQLAHFHLTDNSDDGSQFSDEAFAAAITWGQLSSLEVYSNAITGRNFQPSWKLRKLTLCGTGMNDTTFQHAGSWPDLEEVELDCEGVHGSTLARIGPNLRVLIMRPNGDGESLDQAKGSKKWTKLQTLQCADELLPDGFFKHSAEWVSLTDVDLRQCHALTNAAFDRSAKWPLRVLRLNNAGVTDDALKHGGNWPLRELELIGSGFIGILPSDAWVDIEEIELDGENFTDEAMARTEHCAKLRSLRLDGNFSVKACKHARSWPLLTSLYLTSENRHSSTSEGLFRKAMRRYGHHWPILLQQEQERQRAEEQRREALLLAASEDALDKTMAATEQQPSDTEAQPSDGFQQRGADLPTVEQQTSDRPQERLADCTFEPALSVPSEHPGHAWRALAQIDDLDKYRRTRGLKQVERALAEAVQRGRIPDASHEAPLIIHRKTITLSPAQIASYREQLGKITTFLKENSR